MRMKKSSSRRITIDAIIKRDRDGVYFGVVPELPGCHKVSTIPRHSEINDFLA